MKPEEPERGGERVRREKNTKRNVLCAPFVVCGEAFCEDTGGAMADTAGSGADDVDPFAFVPKVCKTLLSRFLSLSSTSWSPRNGSVLSLLVLAHFLLCMLSLHRVLGLQALALMTGSF